MRLTSALVLSLILIPGALRAQNVSEVQVTPETVTLRVGQKQALFAAAFDTGGNLIPTIRFTFSSNNPTVAQAQADGVIIGLKPGAAIVQVSAGQKSFSVAVSVESVNQPQTTTEAATSPVPAASPPASMITIEPSPVYLLPSENRRLVIRAFRDDGSAAELPRIIWKSLTPETVAVDAEGVIVGLAPGTAIVQASAAGGLAATAPVEISAAEISLAPARLILAPYDLDTITATVPSHGNRELRAGLQWRSSHPDIVRVGPTGIVQAMVPGEAEIIIAGFFQERRIPVRVHKPVETLVVTPKPSAGILRMPLRGTRALTVQAEAADSTPVPEATLWWEVGDSAVAGYDPARGEITALGLGTTTVTLRARGFDPVSWVVEVVPGGIALDQTRFSMELGARTQVKANLVDESGAVLSPAEHLQWTSDRITAAVVGNDGVVEATGFGRARLTATTPWGRSATADVFVVGDVVYSANRGGPQFGIYQVGWKDPSRMVPILADSFQNVQAALSPDRTTIVFSSNRGGDYDLYLVDADGQNIRRVAALPGPDGDAGWTPDGTRLVFTGTRGGATQIFSMDVNGGDIRQLTSLGGGNSSPAVSPDGRWIAFLSGRDGNVEVYRMDIDGSNQLNLSNTREKESAPAFFPNGDLAYGAEVKRAGWQVMRLPAAGGVAGAIYSSPAAITSLGVSRTGDRLAVVAGRVTDPRRGKAEFTFSLVPVGGGAPFQVPLVLNEQVVF